MLNRGLCAIRAGPASRASRRTALFGLETRSIFGWLRRAPSESALDQRRTDITPMDKPSSNTIDTLDFDNKTHTGQAWDNEDYRMIRFEQAPKQINPNIAMFMIAKVPPKAVDSRIACCDGGGGALGHPKIYINLDKPGNHACGYCGLRFYSEHVTQDGSEHMRV